jgi:RimJ/RimL family protein N-acetyltransferase
MSRVLRTARLVLRPEEPRDSEALIRMASLRTGETPEDRAARLTGHAAVSDRWFAEHGYGVWAVEEPGSPALLGYVGAKPNDAPGRPEIMYGFDESARGRGYAAEAAQALLHFLFTLPGTTEVWAQADPANVASWRVMERLGLRFEYRGMFQGEDSVVYRLRREEYSAASPLHDPTPWTGPELAAALERSARRTGEFFIQLSPAAFTAGDRRHWSPAHHLGHLILSHAAVARAFRLGRRLPAHETGRSRGYHELAGVALAGLRAAAPEWLADNPFTFEPGPEPDAAAMARQLADASAPTRAALREWSESDLDTRAIAHPLAGPLTAREMLLFMLLHDRHHVLGVRRRLRADR